MGQDKQLVALPAAVGFRFLLKYRTDPEEDTEVGICGGSLDPAGGEQRSQRRRSISWQDLVSSEGAVVDSLRQFPLKSLVICTSRTGSSNNIPDEAVSKVPPANWFRMLNRQDITNSLVF